MDRANKENKEIKPTYKDLINRLLSFSNSGNIELVRKLLNSDSRININSANKDGVTALIRAAYCNKPEIIKIMVEEMGADTEKFDTNGTNALMHASYKNYSEAIISLIDSNANINSVAESKPEWTALMYAACGGSLQATQCLLDLNADLHITDSQGKTALDHVNMALKSKEIDSDKRCNLDQIAELIKDKILIQDYEKKGQSQIVRPSVSRVTPISYVSSSKSSVSSNIENKR